MREIYLKPFELTVKAGDTHAVMSAFNYIGTEWAGACDELLNTVLRDEWGFQGFVVTDFFSAQGNGYMDADQAIRNGGDGMLVFFDAGNNMLTDTTSATSVLAMRRASKNILYMVVNSRACAPENIDLGLAKWQVALIVVDVIIAAVIIALEVLIIRKYRKAIQSDKGK